MLVLDNETFSLNKYLNINNFRDCWTLQAFYSLTVFNCFLVFLILLVGKKKDLTVFSNTYIQKQNYISSHGALRLLQKSDHKLFMVVCVDLKSRKAVLKHYTFRWVNIFTIGKIIFANFAKRFNFE